MLGPDQSQKINDPSNVTNIPQGSKEKRVIKPEDRNKFKKVLATEEKGTKAAKSKKEEKKAGKEHPFAKVTGKEEKQEEPKKPSLFDLSQGEKEVTAAPKDEEVTQSPFAHTQESKGKKDTSQFAREQPDLSFVNPIEGKLASSAISQSTAPIGKTTEIPQQMIDIINELADKISIMKTKGQTDTTITLKNPPLLNGATLTIRTFATAKGEFNIKFDGLTQAAKMLIDAKVNQEALITGLEQKGYVVHMITTTTYMETRQAEEGQQLAKEKGDEQKRDQDQQEEEQDA